MNEYKERKRGKRRENDKEAAEVVLGVGEEPSLWWPGEAWV